MANSEDPTSYISDDVHSKITEFLDRAEKGMLVQSIRMLLKFLKANNLCYTMKLLPQLVGVHYLNRDGYGINPTDVHILMNDIFDIGFDYEEVRAVCCMISPKERDRATTFIDDILNNSGGWLAKTNTDMMQYLALWGSHTNECLKCIEYEVTHDNADMCIEGRLNKEKIKRKDTVC